ncbi:MAG TPA: PIN domain-containing protein [Candidatus Acidoferrum sp.]|nr:PIN domain-containing protein [Candidatus Acidoferrum sp.]
MSGPDFVDTNILVYAYTPADARKQKIAQGIVARALSGEGTASSQVLAEFAATLLHKATPPMRPEQVVIALDALGSMRLVPLDQGIVRRAIEARAAYGIHFYDGMIVAAAERGACKRILSEDLNAGQRYFQISVENPF